MADDTDLASEREEIARASALRAVTEKAKEAPVLLHVGACHNCDAVLDAPLLFCDPDCRDDWQRRSSRK